MVATSTAALSSSNNSGSRTGGASWLMAAYLLLNGIMAPAVLAQPYAFAVLGWGGGIAVNLVMALASWYCMYHQASLFHYKGRNSTYQQMGNAVLAPYMGPWGGVLIAFLQYFINVGSTISNMILSGQLLQAVYSTLCCDPQHCTFNNTSAWIAMAGALSYVIFIAVPDMAVLAWASICGSMCAVYYCIAGMVMAGIDGHATTANYTITGPTEQQVFNALNGIGILLFLFGITVLPEIQDVLADDPETGSTSWPMIKAATGVHCVFVPLYMLVGVIGFWAYGTDVASFLLFANSQPRGLVVSAELLAAFQLQLVSQVMMLPVFEAAERSWIKHAYKHSRHWALGRAAAAAATPAAAASKPACQHDMMTARMSTLASQLSRSFIRSRSTSSHLPFSKQDVDVHEDSMTTPACTDHPHMCEHHDSLLTACAQHDALRKVGATDDTSSGIGTDLHAALSIQEQQQLSDQQHHQLHAAMCYQATGDSQLAVSDSTAAAAAALDARDAAAAAADHAVQPSLLLKLLNRTLLTGLMLFVACALPFFGAIMGFFGAVGFGPITYALPTALYMLAFGEKMPQWEWWCNVVFIVFWLLASLLGAIGSVYAIVISASTYSFFS